MPRPAASVPRARAGTHRGRAIAASVAVVALLVARGGPVAGQEVTSTTTTTSSSSTTSTTRPSTSTSTTTSTAPPTSLPPVGPPGTDSTPTTEPDTSTTSEAPPVTAVDIEANPDLAELPPGELELIAQYLQVRQEARDLADRISALNQALTDLQNELVTAQGRVRAAEARADAARDRVGIVEYQLGAERAKLRRHAVAAYINGGSESDPASVLLRADSVDELSRSVAYADAVISDERAIIRRTEDLQRRAGGVQSDADREAAAAQAARDDVDRRNAELNRRRDELIGAQRLLVQNAERERSVLSEAALRRLAVDEQLAGQARLSDGISETLAARQAGQVVPALTEGLFLSPLPNPRITSPFGARVDPLFGTVRGHPGIDINGATGTPIRAAGDGVVVTAGWIGGYGNAVIVDHGNGLATLYAHQSALLVNDGSVVRRGQTIGLVGSTGYSTGPHLHWEVRVMGKVVNPVPYLGQLT